jgi:hypothetical protein
MATKRRSIAGAIKAAAHSPTPIKDAPPDKPDRPASPGLASGYRAKTREGKKPIYAPIDPAAKVTLKILSAETGKTQENLIREAIRDLFIKYGKPAVA